MKIFYWNCAAGLPKKLDFVKDLINENNIDAFFIAEAEIRSDFDLSVLSMRGYDLILSDTFLTRGKSRLICLKKHYLNVKRVGSDYDEIIVLEHKNTSVIGLYRPFKVHDGETEESNFTRMLNTLRNIEMKRERFIIGDFNIDLNKISTKFRDELSEWSDNLNLSVVEVGITRSRWVSGQLQESVLDFLLTNSLKFDLSKECSDLSDHYILKLNCHDFDPVKREKSVIEITNWNFDKDLANEFLMRELSRLPLMFSSVSELDYRIRASLLSVFNRFVKTRQMLIRNSNEVVSPMIVRLKNYRNRARKKWIKNKTAENYVTFVRASRHLRAEVRKVKSKIIKSKMSRGSKEFWSEINQLRGKSNRQVSKLIIDNKEISDPSVICNTFMSFFTDKIDKLIEGYTPVNVGLDLSNSAFTPFSLEEIDRAFSRLSNKKSSGMDCISGFFIKIFQKTVREPLRTLFNRIIETDHIPETWKIAKISPVHKKGSFSDCSNFRPVSNLATVSKLFELCLLQRMEEFDMDNIMGISQHGFRKYHSTDSAICEVVSSISEGLDDKLKVGMYSADLTAAFDLLRKERLVEMMMKKGLPEYLVKIIHNYLSDRMGYVQIGEDKSCVRDIRTGCVQGSILGPVLFNIYTSDLAGIVSPCKLIAYADDAYIVASSSCEDELKIILSDTMRRHFDWLNTIGMVCNQQKTELIAFGCESFNLSIDNVVVPTKDSIKILGIVLDNQLKFDALVNKINSRCRSFVFSLKYIRNYLSDQDIVEVFRAQIIPIITYAAPAWSSHIGYQLRSKLRSTYYFILRLILRDFGRNLNRSGMLRKSGLDSIDTLLFKRTSVFLFNLIYNLLPTQNCLRLLTKSYFNDRTPHKLFFFDTSSSKIGRICITNQAKNLSEKWTFNWLELKPNSFKNKLREQLKFS